MARSYRVSADMSEVEKIVGGVLTLAQGLWLVLGLAITGGIFLLLAQLLPPVLALIIGLIPGAAAAFPFAFYTKGGLPLFTYLQYKRAFKKKNHTLINTLTYNKDFLEGEGI